MRHIARDGKQPDPSWLAKADALLEQLKTAPDADGRNAIIDAKAKFWGELKEWLLKLSHDKCWYSEAKDCFSHWHVEHYRPKKTAKDEDGTEYEGYWWLAFDWTNLRICGSAGNPKKGTYFPLRAGCGRCPPHGDIRLEDPQLLDPADVRDPSLLTFNVLGEALAAPGLDDEWDQARVGYSVDRCNLNFPALMGKRKVVWADCWHGIRTYLAELRRCAEDPANAVARGACKAAARGILAMMRPEAELSAVARACVLSSGNQQVQRLLQSA